jgi:hypothetical protein
MFQGDSGLQALGSVLSTPMWKQEGDRGRHVMVILTREFIVRVDTNSTLRNIVVDLTC